MKPLLWLQGPFYQLPYRFGARGSGIGLALDPAIEGGQLLGVQAHVDAFAPSGCRPSPSFCGARN